MKIFYTDHFVLPLPEGHRFPMSKYSLLRERVAAMVLPNVLTVPHAATDEEITRAHDPDYLRRVQNGELLPLEIRKIGFPWTPQMVERSRRSSGATVEAARYVLETGGFAVSLAGGTHHAFRASGGGYCVFNDSAIAARAMQAEGRAERVVIIDLDVHQGDGTAAIFEGDDTVFTFSMHGATNYPFHKMTSDLDIALDDHTGDAEYLAALQRGLWEAIERSRADVAIYLAGADPFHGDRLGKLALTKVGLAARDEMVLTACRDAGLPVAITMAGGYAKDVRDTVDIHFATVSAALRLDPSIHGASQGG
jgi:acetoin utilization deacetylase AcuC-like enzyme